MDGDKILMTPILEVLEYFRIHGCPYIDTRIYKKGARDLFLRSPFRDEKDASFCIMEDTNCWKDFGSGLGGGVLKLVRMLGNIPEKSISDKVDPAILFLSKISKDNMDFGEVQPREWKRGKAAPALEVTSVFACFTDEPLIRYASSRGIPRELLDRYCYQVSFHSLSNKDYYHTNIGFPNISGGYSYRGPGKFDKGCTTSQITTIDSDGKYSLEPLSDTVVVFEGFFDFLSYMQYNRLRALDGEAGSVPDIVHRMASYTPVSDVVVLNSVNNLGCAESYLKAHRRINSCLDNDKAGEVYFENLRNMVPESEVIDRSMTYKPYKDFNDFLIQYDKARKGVEMEVKL